MPGRYSHSVVLAGYSSQGIINLPNDQHVQYLKSSPYSTKISSCSNTNSRTGQQGTHPRSQSAMHVRSEPWVPTSSGVKVKSRRVYIEADVAAATSLMSDRAQPRPASTTPARQRYPSDSQQRNYGSRATAIRLDDQSCHQDFRKTTGPIPASKPVLQHTIVSPISSAQKTNESTANRQRRAARSELLIGGDVLETAKSQTLPRKAPIGSKSLKPQRDLSPTVAIPPPTQRSFSDANQRGQLQHRGSSMTVQTQIHNPIHDPLEPNFDGFDDGEESSTSYFTSQSPQLPQLSEEQDSTAWLSRTTSTPLPVNIMSRPRQSYQNLSSPGSPKSDHKDAAMSIASTMNLTSRSSISSIGSFAAQHSGRGTKATETKKPHANLQGEQWGLPEIEENSIFDPDIFAQGLDTCNDFDRDFAAPGLDTAAFGMISSGRDVDFQADDNDDAESMESACPPDIGRYRDVEEIAPTQLKIRLGSEDDRCPSPALTSVSSKRGFLAKLKPRLVWG